MAAANGVQLFVTIIAFSLIFSSFDLPISRALKAISASEDTLEVEDEFVLIQRRMEFEINRDYPGSGANNRHTPNPPVKD
ncbi:hypothetical protein ACP275_05G008700 [Erythranthe tilingii]